MPPSPTARSSLVLLPVLLLVLLAALAPARAASAQGYVDVELVLAVDVSRSMDMDEQALQRAGYVEAFRDPAVHAAIASGIHQRIAVTYVEWAGTGLSNVVVPWMILAGGEDANAFADRLAVPTPSRIRRTSISGAIAMGRREIETNDVVGLRRVIDISGDGPNNEGAPVIVARDAAVASGITVNGLPLILKPPSAWGIEDLDIYYEDCVIGGPGAFLITVRDPANFTEAIRRKLILEIAGAVPDPRRVDAPLVRNAQFAPPRPPRIDCMIGETIRQRRERDWGDF